MRTVSVTRHKRNNFFITDNEAFLIWKESGYYPKLQLMVGFALFRGMRIGEIRAINVRDFKNADFSKMDIVLQKSNIIDEFPLIGDFAAYLKKYILKNILQLRGGYVFPTYKKLDQDYMSKATCNFLFYQFRKKLIKKYGSFGERAEYYIGKRIYYRYRVGWHSMRRWFETKLWDSGHSVEQIAHIMRYTNPKTVYTYLDCYKVWKSELTVLDETFSGLFRDCSNLGDGQKTLAEF